MVALGLWSLLPGPSGLWAKPWHSYKVLAGRELGLTPLLRLSGAESEVQGAEEVKAGWTPPSTTPRCLSQPRCPCAERVGLRCSGISEICVSGPCLWP